MGTCDEPFSAHRYRDIQRELSHVTLAEREMTSAVAQVIDLAAFRTAHVEPEAVLKNRR